MPAMIDRRELMAALGRAAVAWPMTAYAQQPLPVIGYATRSVKLSYRFLANVRKGLAELGYVEGQNFRFEFRETNRELADQKVTLIITTTTTGVAAAKAVTQTIPIVFNIGTDPVENGFVASLNKPGGNITGMFNLGLTLAGKRVEVLHELVPSVTKFALLTDPENLLLSQLQMKHVKAAADSLRLDLLNVNAHTSDELEAAFETAVREGAGGMVVGQDAIFSPFSTQLVTLAGRYRLPTIYVNDTAVKEGGFVSYGADEDEPNRLVGNYAGRILKGEKPADIPVQLLTKTKLLINLKTAKDLGITVPTPLLGRADDMIE
jgi:putative tryptophan/tyrosine transport system substrate-binding protein